MRMLAERLYLLAWERALPPGRFGLTERLLAARRRRQARRELLELDDRLLRDIGISRLDAAREAKKPFWR